MVERYSTGNKELDKILGGGLIRGTKTIIYGPAGIGKSILGVSVAHAGIKEDHYPGLMISDGFSIDDQRQVDYAKKFFDWDLKSFQDNSKHSKSKKNSIDESFLFNFPVKEAMNVWRHHDYWNSPYGPRYFKNSFIVFHLPKTKRVVLDDLLQGSVSSLKEFFNEYNSSNQTKVFDNEEVFKILTNDKQMKLYAEKKLKNVKFGFSTEYFSENDKEFKEYEKIGLRKMNETFGNGGYPSQHICSFQTWKRELMKPVGPIAPNVRLENNIPKDHSFVINMTTDEKNIFNIVNGSVINRELEAGVNTIIALGYLPSSEENMVQKQALAVLKHRGSFYNKKIFNYEITDSGFEIKK